MLIVLLCDHQAENRRRCCRWLLNVLAFGTIYFTKNCKFILFGVTIPEFERQFKHSGLLDFRCSWKSLQHLTKDNNANNGRGKSGSRISDSWPSSDGLGPTTSKHAQACGFNNPQRWGQQEMPRSGDTSKIYNLVTSNMHSPEDSKKCRNAWLRRRSVCIEARASTPKLLHVT